MGTCNLVRFGSLWFQNIHYILEYRDKGQMSQYYFAKINEPNVAQIESWLTIKDE
jgi:hypothetical protein